MTHPEIPYCPEDGGEIERNEIESGIDLVGTVDPIDMMTVQARIPGPQGFSWWTIGMCGDYGLGLGLAIDKYLIDFNTFAAYTEIAGCLAGDTPFGDEVLASACILDCDYRIDDLTESSLVIMANIPNGKGGKEWSILKVTNAALVGFVGLDCGCCGLDRVVLKAKVLSAGAGCPVSVDDEFYVHPSQGTSQWAGGDGGEGEIPVTLVCSSDDALDFEDETDWAVTICGEAATISSFECSEGGDPNPFRLVAGVDGPLEGCDDCGPVSIEFTATTLKLKDICYEYEDIEEVKAEGCGMPELEEGDEVIMLRLPNPLASDPDAVEWYIITACSSKETCDVYCDPPPPPDPLCCGVVCSEWPTTLTLTAEVLTGVCAGCTDTVTLTKQGCESNTEYTTAPDEVFCSVIGEYSYSTGFLYLSCNSPTDECGNLDPEGIIFSLEDDFGTIYTLDQETACCNPLYLEFTGAPTDRCLPDPAGDGSSTIKIIITA